MRQQDDGGPGAPSGLRSSPTGRVPQWVLDEAAGRPAPPDPRQSWSAAEPTGRRRSWIGVLSAVVAVVLLGAAAVHLDLLPRVAVPAASAASDPSPEAGIPHPTPGFESSDTPLGTPIAAAAGGGAYEFVQLQADGVTPVAYDPCRPIHWIVRPDNAPYGGTDLIQDAVARISEVTGLTFVHDGVTDESQSDQREPFQPERYGDRWAPVLITWDTVAEEPDFAAEVAGRGGSMALSLGDGPRVYVTGAVALDAAQFIEILTRPDGEATARAIVLHEFAHVLGLGHVDDPTQLMYPTTSDVHDFAAGDLAGLAQLGSGVCVPEV